MNIYSYNNIVTSIEINVKRLVYNLSTILTSCPITLSSTPKVKLAFIKLPFSTSGSQKISSAHILSKGISSTLNYSGLISSLS